MCRNSTTSALNCRNSSAWCTAVGRWPGRRPPGRAPPSRGSTGSAARRAPSARADPARRAARRPARWSPAAAARVTTRPSSRRHARSRRPSRGSRRHPAVARPRRRSRGPPLGRARSSSSGVMPSRRQVVVHAAGRGVARLARVDHQHRPAGPRQGQRPAQAGGAAADHDHVVARPCLSSAVVVDHLVPHMRLRRRAFDKDRCRSGKYCDGQPTRRRAGRGRARGCARCGSSAARRWPSCPRRPASRSARCRGWSPGSAGRPWSCCCRWPAPTGCRSTSWSARPPTGDPRVHARPFTATRHDVPAADPPTGRAAGVQARHPAERGRAGSRSRRSHEGYEWLYVLSGRLRLLLGEHDLVLHAGEAAEFDTRVPHCFGSAGAEPVELLMPVRPAGRAHARPRSPRVASKRPLLRCPAAE